MTDPLIVDTGTTGFRIDRLWAFLSIGEDGDEGVCSISTTLGHMPMVAADRRRVDQLRPYAAKVAKTTGRPVRLARFDTRADEETFNP